MLQVTPHITIDEAELCFTCVRASGPGGQNVNKVASAVQLRFDVVASPSLPDEVKARLRRLAGKRMTEDGVLMIDARQHRSQERNRTAAVKRLLEWLRKAAERPKVRRPTRPTAGSKRRRLESKRKRGETKSRRGTTPDGDA